MAYEAERKMKEKKEERKKGKKEPTRRKESEKKGNTYVNKNETTILKVNDKISIINK